MFANLTVVFCGCTVHLSSFAVDAVTVHSVPSILTVFLETTLLNPLPFIVMV